MSAKKKILALARELVVDSGVKKYFRLKYWGLRMGPWAHDGSFIIGHRVRVYSTIGAFKPYCVTVKR